MQGTDLQRHYRVTLWVIVDGCEVSLERLKNVAEPQADDVVRRIECGMKSRAKEAKSKDCEGKGTLKKGDKHCQMPEVRRRTGIKP